MASRRAGVTLVELLFAAAVLSVALVAGYGSLWQGFQNGVDLRRREIADAVARNVLDRFVKLPYPLLEARFDLSREVDLLDDGDPAFLAGLPVSAEALRRADVRVLLEVGRLPGERPALLVASRVRWPGPNRRPRELRYARHVFPQVEALSRGLRQASGFEPRADRRQEWGSAESWRPAPAPSQGARPGLAFEGDPALVARYLGPGGELSRRRGDPDRVRQARSLRARQRFLSRAGVVDKPWEFDALPDGSYPFRLEAVDLRSGTGEGQVSGVYVLRSGGGEELFLVADARHQGGDVTRSLEGDTVLERLGFRGEGGAPWLLQRTAHRLFLFRFSPDPLRRRVWVQELGAPDEGHPGTPMTQRQRDALVGRHHLEPVEVRTDELLAAVPGAFQASGGGEPGPAFACHSSRGGTCRLRRQRLGPAPVLRRVPAPPAEEPEVPGWLVAAADPDPGAALRGLDEYLLGHPDDVRARAERARRHAAAGNIAFAVDELRRVVDAPAVRREVLPDLAGLLIQRGELEEASRHLADLEQEFPTAPYLELSRSLVDAERRLAQLAPPSAGGGGDDLAGGATEVASPIGATLGWNDPRTTTGSMSVRPRRF